MPISESDDNGHKEPSIEKQIPTAPQRFREFGNAALESIGMMYFDPKGVYKWRAELSDSLKLMNDAFKDALKTMFDTAQSPSEFAAGVAELMIEQQLIRRAFEARMFPDTAQGTYDKAELHDRILGMYYQVTDTQLLLSYIRTIHIQDMDADLQRMIEKMGIV